MRDITYHERCRSGNLKHIVWTSHVDPVEIDAPPKAEYECVVSSVQEFGWKNVGFDTKYCVSVRNMFLLSDDSALGGVLDSISDVGHLVRRCTGIGTCRRDSGILGQTY